ncbi:putative amidoligase enzyme-domain-containing protein [Xylaria intraflava]|nr:putative amidoligase enzyme-domain-containing protein [Xylaria intraflava]
MAPHKSSIGVELEFLVCTTQTDGPLTPLDMFRSSKGAPAVLNAQDHHDGIIERVQSTIKKAVEQHRGSRVVQSEDEVNADMSAWHLLFHQDWSVGADMTITFPDELKTQYGINDYTWYPMEISSPALWATEDSWEEIRAVVQAIIDQYWIITPESAGMHFHYGNGKDYIPFENLRRMAAMSFAVDPLIVQLHAEHRRNNAHCVSNRLYSRVAHGRLAADAATEIGATSVEAEPEIPGAEPGPAPLTRRPSHERTAGLSLPFRRGALAGYEFDQYLFKESVCENDPVPGKDPRPTDILTAVREILKCQNAPTVAELMSTSPIINNRHAYSFHHYIASRYKVYIRTRDGTDRLYQHRRTVEFRQPAATMVPEEVVAHGKITARLCEFAAEADLAAFWKVVNDCAFGEEHGHWYDVFDLLADLGLIDEANYLATQYFTTPVERQN